MSGEPKKKILYELKAVDQLFFRSSIPFEADGGSHLLKSHFPPLPGTYGGVFANFIQDEKKAKALRISYNGLLINDEFYFPQPLDMFIPDIKSDQALQVMNFYQPSLSKFPLDLCLKSVSKSKDKDEQDRWIAEKQLTNYLKGCQTVANEESKLLSDYLPREAKIGIEINQDKRKAQEGMLYQIEMVRPSDKLELAVQVEELELAATHVKLGGEGKVAHIKQKEMDKDVRSILDKELNEKVQSKYFKLYFATPAIFKKGWLPKWIDEETKIGEFSYRKRKIKVKLIAAAVGKPVAIGGFDTSNGHPKEMRYAIPSGSVYYFEILSEIENGFEVARSLFHEKCISDYREGLGFDHDYFSRTRLIYCDRGFGYAFIGQLTEQQHKEVLKYV